MDIHGNLNLLGGLLRNFRLEELDTWPEEPKIGAVIFKGKRIYICLGMEDGTPIWLPISNELNTHVFDQFVPARVWTIDHRLQTAGCIVQVLSGDNKAIGYDEVDFAYNQATITFSEPQAGRAILIMGSTEGLPRPLVAFEDSFTASATWTVRHMLGYNPIVRCFIGAAEVQPASITHPDVNTAIVTFNSPVSGRVRCI